MRVESMVLGPVGTNCYLLINGKTREVILVDPGDNAPAIVERLNKEDLTPKAILLTHGHFDHIMAAEELSNKYGISIYAYYEEWDVLKDADLNAGYLVRKRVTLIPHKELRDNEVITIAGIELTVIHTPGHTKGSVCFYNKEAGVLISGDTLFYESVGRTDLPTGDYDTIKKSIKERLFCLEDDTKVYPGHGDMTTIGHEKVYNPYVG